MFIKAPLHSAVPSRITFAGQSGGREKQKPAASMWDTMGQ